MTKNTKPKFNLVQFVFCIFITEFAGIIGSVFTFSSVNNWYLTELIKPSFTPPSWLFGPVWTLLFFLMGWSLYLTWTKSHKIIWFWFQLVLNILWSFIFFGLRSPWFAFIEITILWLTIIKSTIEAYSFNKKAGILLLPYLAWVTFAAFLNFSIASLN